MASGSTTQKDSGEAGQLSTEYFDMMVSTLRESKVECAEHRNSLNNSLLEACGHIHCSDCLDNQLKKGR